MKAWRIEAFSETDLVCVDAEPDEPGPGEVAIRVLAVSLNYRDLLVRRGTYNPRQALPLVPCSDAVGEVVAVGPGVTGRAVGDRVVVGFSVGWIDGPPTDVGLATALGSPLDGTLRERMVVPAHAVVPAPAHLDDVQAATLPCAGVTAWRALSLAGVGAGDTVLTLGTGGVSVFALQIATALGARVAITSSSDAKLARARDLGADLTVNYVAEPRWDRVVRQWREGGVDCVVEVGGAGTLARSLGAVRTGGTIALIGVLDGASGEVPLTRILMRSVRVQGIFVGSVADLAGLCTFLSCHPEITPVVDRVFDFDAAPSAFAHLASGTHLGKVVIRVA